jgi:hypothetical protein
MGRHRAAGTVSWLLALTYRVLQQLAVLGGVEMDWTFPEGRVLIGNLQEVGPVSRSLALK